MCRQIAFYHGGGEHDLTRREVMEACHRMMGSSNTDGIGSAHIENGEIKIQKWPVSLESILKQGKSFLKHLESPEWTGWTLVHLRAASVGDVKIENTHPFNIDNKIAFCHNGTAGNSENNLLRLAMSKTVKFEGETDSETLGHLLSISGAREFAETVKSTGVFFSLRKDGTLYVIKTSGSLDVCKRGDYHFFASDISFKKYPDAEIVSNNGWFYLDKNGKMLSKKETKSSSGHTSYGGNGVSAMNASSMSEYYRHRWAN